MKNKIFGKEYVYIILVVVFILGGFMIFGSMADNLGVIIIKPNIKKATNLSFCPTNYPDLMFSLNTQAGNFYGPNDRTQRYVTFDDFANALKSELNANANSTRCSYKVTLYYQDENETKIALECGKADMQASFATGNHNISCISTRGSGSSGVLYITDRGARLQINLGSGIQEFVEMPAYYVEKMMY